MALEVGAIKGSFTLKDEFSKPMMAVYDSVNKTLSKVEAIPKAVGQASQETVKETKKMSDSFVGLGAAIAGIGFAALAKSTLDASAKFEKYNAVLKNSLQSQQDATKAMGMLQTLAAKTPFTLDELTASYIKFVNRGLKPTQQELINLGDIAASQGKSFDQLVEAVLDAGSGEFERLKEFGIRASVAGNQVTLAFRGITQTVEKTPEALQAALVSFGQLNGVAGSMAAISGTLEGRFSNLEDATMALKKTIGDQLAPTFKELVNLAINVVEGITAFAKENPNLTRTIVLTTAALAAMALAMTTLKGIVMVIPFEAMKAGAGIATAFGPASLAFVAIAGLLALFVNLDSAARNARMQIEEMNQEFNKTGSVTQSQKQALEGLASTLVNVEKNTAAARVVQQQFAKTVDQAAGLTAEHRRQLKVWSESAITSKDAANTLVTSVQSLNVAQQNTTKTANPAIGVLKGLGNSAKDAGNEAASANPKLMAFEAAIQAISDTVKEFANQAIQNFMQRMQNQLQSARRKIEEFAVIGQVYTARLKEQLERETKEFEAQQDAQLAAFIAAEEEKLKLEKEAANERVKIITDEYLARKSLQDEEFARRQAQVKAEFEMQKEARRLEYEQKFLYLQRESADKEQAQLAEKLMKQNWAAYELDWQQRLNEALVELAQTKSTQDQQLSQEEKDAIAAQEQANSDRIAKIEEEKAKRIADADMEKEKRIQDFRDKQKQREKEESKKIALIKYSLDVAALEIQKQVARAQATLSLAQGVMSAVAMAPVTFGVSLGLIPLMYSTYQLSMAAIGSQFVVPPAELFLNKGGAIVPGAGMSDTVPARLTPGEMVIDRSTTEGLRDMVHSGRMDKNATININFMAGSIQNNGMMDERAMDDLSYAITRRLEREYGRT